MVEHHIDRHAELQNIFQRIQILMLQKQLFIESDSGFFERLPESLCLTEPGIVISHEYRTFSSFRDQEFCAVVTSFFQIQRNAGELRIELSGGDDGNSGFFSQTFQSLSALLVGLFPDDRIETAPFQLLCDFPRARVFNAPQVDHRGKESDLFHQSRRDVSVIGGKMGDVPVAEKDPDDRKTLPGLVFHEFCRIRERSDSLAPDHIPFGGQLLHGFADGLPADSELFRQFQNRRNPHGLTVRIENQAIDVLSDFFVLRHRVLPHPILLFL